MDDQYQFPPILWVLLAVAGAIFAVGYALEIWRRERKSKG